MPDVQHKRGSRADLNTLAAANGLLLGQIYVITDEDRLAVATGVGTYQAAEKEGGGGGSALELYAENPSSPTAPSATGANAVAIGTNASAAGFAATALGENSSAAGVRNTAIGGGNASSNSEAIAIGSGAVASANVSTAIGQDTDATSAAAVALGYQAQAAGSGATALTKSRASGADSFAAAIANNSSSYGATGANSVAMGRLAKASGAESVAIGSSGTLAADTNSISIGRDSLSDASRAVAIGGGNALSSYSHSFGYQSATPTVQGHYAYASGRFSSVGDAQGGSFVLRSDTTDDTPEAVTTRNQTPSATNQVILPNNSAFAFHGTIVARQQASGGTACAAWKVEGLIRREANAGTTVLVNSATTILDNTPAWGMALSADTTNGGLKIEVTGAAATNIRWVATLNTSEVTY